MGSPLSKPTPKSQAQMCDAYLAKIKESPVYDKFGQFRFRPSIEGETIDSIINGEIETTNTAKARDVVLLGTLNEMYLIGESKFKSRYEVLTDYSEREFGIAKATGKINAIKVTEENFEESFVASWDEEMFPQVGGWYACPVEGEEVYFINEKAFEETYKLA
jgi:hypothetical protein